jgi:hypothetical protein
MKIRHILVLCFSFFEANSFGHEQIVHQAITFNAAESALADSSAYADFLNTISSDLALKDATNAMVEGSLDEDFTLAKDPIGGNRSLNHFYDPIHKVGGEAIGLTVVGIALGRNSFDWGSISNETSVNVGWPINKYGTYNIWSWQNARYYEWLGLTATNQSCRLTNLENMFRAVGQVMHLLEDTSQPQHVRNEQHLDQFWHMDLRSRSAIEDYGKKHLPNLNYANGMLDWRSAGFNKLKDFWNRDKLRAEGATALNADLSGGANTLGLAEFYSGNFIGQRAIYAEFFNDHSDIHYFPFPSLKNTTQPNLKEHNLWGTATHGNITFENFKQGTRLYISKNTGAGIPVTYHSALSYLIAEHPGKSSGMPILTIADDNVLSNYHNVFIPKAVEYSAGLLDYFFRGQLSAYFVSGSPPGTLQLQIYNYSGQDFSGGTFQLFYDNAAGVRIPISSFTPTSIDVLLDNDSITAQFTMPGCDLSDVSQFILVYKGSIGTEDNVDANIAVAATTVYPPGDNSWCNSSSHSGDEVYIHSDQAGSLVACADCSSGSGSPGDFHMRFVYGSCSWIASDVGNQIQHEGGGHSDYIFGSIIGWETPCGQHYYTMLLTCDSQGSAIWSGKSGFQDTPAGVYTRTFECSSGPTTITVSSDP